MIRIPLIGGRRLAPGEGFTVVGVSPAGPSLALGYNQDLEDLGGDTVARVNPAMLSILPPGDSHTESDFQKYALWETIRTENLLPDSSVCAVVLGESKDGPWEQGIATYPKRPNLVYAVRQHENAISENGDDGAIVRHKTYPREEASDTKTKDDGDLLLTKTQNAIKAQIKKRNKQDAVQLVLGCADGNANTVRLMWGQLATALLLLRPGGHFVLRTAVTSLPVLTLIEFASQFFEETVMVRPVMSHNLNDGYHVVFKSNTATADLALISQITVHICRQTRASGKHVIALFPTTHPTPSPLESTVRQMNTQIAAARLAYILRVRNWEQNKQEDIKALLEDQKARLAAWTGTGTDRRATTVLCTVSGQTLLK